MSRCSTFVALFFAIVALFLISAPGVNAQLGGCTASAPTSKWSVGLTFVVANSAISNDFSTDIVSGFNSVVAESLGINRAVLSSAVTCGSATSYTFADPTLNTNYGHSYQVVLYIDQVGLKLAGSTYAAPAIASAFIKYLKANPDLSSSILPSPMLLLADSLTLSNVQQ